MKRTILVALLCAGIFGVAFGAYRVAAPPEPQLSRFVPSGAVLYLQAKNFSSLLADWDKSQEREAWLKSKNHDVFSQSRLLLRLQSAGDEFAKAAGVPVDADLLHQAAGRQSALVLYDIGKLQFLFISRRASAESMQSALWQTRSKFETRSAGGVNFFYRKDPDSDREIAFAIAGDYLLLATREDLLAGALQLLAGSKEHCVEEEPWWSRSVAATGAPGDLRMVLNLEKIVPSPYFRSYWVQQNITDMKRYTAAISDLTRSGSEYHEERTLLRKEAAAHDRPEGKGAAAVGEILRLVPANTGFYEAKADPEPKDSLELLTAKILAPHLGPGAPGTLAPQVQLGGGETGSGSDLETRIDQPPAQSSVPGDSSAPIQAVFEKNHVLAQRGHCILVRLLASAWSDAKKSGLGIDRAQAPITGGFDPRDVLADCRDLPAFERLRRNEHREIGLAAGRRKCCRDVILPPLGRRDRENQHVLGKPALLAAHV